MSQLLQRCGRVSDFSQGGLGSIPSRGKGVEHFFHLLHLVPNIYNPMDGFRAELSMEKVL